MKRSFIPKELRPDVPGQYYQIEEVEKEIDPLSGISIDDLSNSLTRRKIIIQLIQFLEDKEEYLTYKKALFSMFPCVVKKIAQNEV